MKNERTIKLKRITLISVAVAVAVAAITLMTLFLPKFKPAQAATGVNEAKTSGTETLGQIERLEEEYRALFDEHAELWEKYYAELQQLDEIPDDFSEKEYIGGLSALTDEEKTVLLKNIDALDALDAKLDKLYGDLFDTDEDVLYGECEDGVCDFAEREDKYFADNGCGDYDMPFIENDENFFGENFLKACEEAERENDMIQSLKKEFDELTEARAELWDKVYASYDETDENFDYANFDEAKYIAELTVLTAEEKEVLLKDLARLNEISQKLYGICGANCGRW